MGSMYQLDSLAQGIRVSNTATKPATRPVYDINSTVGVTQVARETAKDAYDGGPTPRNPMINIEYETDVPTDSSVHPASPIRAWVYDEQYGHDWTPLDGPVLGFLRIFAWYDMTIGRFSSVRRSISAFRSFHDEIKLHMMLYTSNNMFNITGSVNLMGDRSYLGCTASSRTSRIGEDWTRGSDLADGQYSKETWDRICFDMLSYELQDPSMKMDLKWGLFPDDAPGCAHSHERRIGYVVPGYDNCDSDVSVPDEAMRLFH